MLRNLTVLALVVAGLGAGHGAALAFDARLDVAPAGGGHEITVVVEDTTPPGWGDLVGYAVVRWVHGVCEDPVFLTDVLAFTDPIDTVIDPTPPDDLAYSYVVALVESDGTPSWYAGWQAIATLGGLEHPVVRGHLQSGGVFGGGYLVACPDMCWELPFLAGSHIGISATPEHVADAIDTGQVFDIHGEVGYGWEGPYIQEVTAGIPTDCDQVATVPQSWSALKRRFE